MAAVNGHSKVVHLLVSCGAQVDAVDKVGGYSHPHSMYRASQAHALAGSLPECTARTSTRHSNLENAAQSKAPPPCDKGIRAEMIKMMGSL